MQRLAIVFLAMCVSSSMLVVAAGADSGAPYGWTLSRSATDPYENTREFLPGLNDMYLWFTCSTPKPEGPGGMAAAQFAVISDELLNAILFFVPQNGFLNAGTGSNLLLAVGGCPTGPVLAGIFTTLDNTPGQYCFEAYDNIKATIDCAAIPNIWSMEWIGLDSGTGMAPCAKGNATCTPPTPVGACCIQNQCTILTERECIGAGGDYQGDGAPCDPDPCVPIAVESETWGAIKATYR